MSKLACLTRGKDRAFPAHPRVERYFAAAAIEDARQRLGRCIDRGDGPGLVVGPTGTGKTLLLQLLATQFADRFAVACLTSTPLSSRRALLQSILFELRQPYRDHEAGELRLALVELLLDRTQCPEGLLLLVDEAHLLSIRLLEELRVLSNLTCAGEPRVRLVLAGSLQLDELFTAPELEVFNQRLTARCYLSQLSHAETVQYARAQIAAAGAKPDELFDPDALDALYQASDGVPRLINQICDRALCMASDRKLIRLDKQAIEAAWADLQQLPTPWNDDVKFTSVDTSTKSVIEFGSLEEGDLGFIEEPTEIDTEEELLEPLSVGPTMRVFQNTLADEEERSEVGLLAVEAEPKVVEVPVSSVSTRQHTVDPFAESFQEEEVVLDRFATLEAAFHHSTPRVRNRRETSWSQLLRDADPVEETAIEETEFGPPHPARGLTGESLLVDEYDGEIEDRFDEHLLPQLSRLLAQTRQTHKSNSQESHADSFDSDVLLIEEDEASPVLVNRQVERKEFRQLFASLRGD